MISAVLLAAGAARRFGAPKLREELHGQPLIRWSAELLRREPVGEVIVVVAPEHDDVRRALQDVDVKFVVNDRPDDGIGRSLACGVAAAQASSEALLVALGDTPMLRRDALQRVVARYRADGAAIVVPMYQGVRGHPVLFSRSVFPELAALTGDAGARAVTDRDPGRVAFVELESDAPLDVDTPQDLDRLRALPPRGTLLDELMPHYDVNASYSAVVDAPTAAAYRAVRETDLSRSLVSRLLVAIRSMGGRGPAPFRFGQLPDTGGFFALADDPPREIVAGVIGRFWRRNGAVVDGSRRAFEAALPRGMAKAAWSFRVDDHARGARVTTETRVLCADDDARRQFLRYWTIIGPFSGVIRREALRLIRNQAQFISPSP